MSTLYGYNTITFVATGEVSTGEEVMGWTSVQPPELEEGQRAVFNGVGWNAVDIPEPEAEPAPNSVTPRQLREWLIDKGIMPSQVDAMVEAIEDETEREKMKVYWEYSTAFFRNHPKMIAFAEQLGVEDLDEAFREAAVL